MIFDTHAHYDDEQFADDREELLEQVFASGIGCVVDVGVTAASSRAALSLAARYPRLYAAVGLHPEELKGDWREELTEIAPLLAQEKTVALGEIGLDYYWNKENKEEQQAAFAAQLAMAREADKPVIVHSRDAAADTLEMMRAAAAAGTRGVMHCYSYSVEHAREYVKLGFYLGIGGVVTFANAKTVKEVVQAIPLSSLVLETDCPYLAPKPFRGKRNSSLYLPYVVEQIALLKGITVTEVEEATYANALRLFGLQDNQQDQ